MRQSSKQNTIRTTKPVVSTMACEVGSTAEDVTGWSTDSTGNKTDSGRLALSTTSATTITGCATVYPELFARAPSAWKSGNDLVVPPQTIGTYLAANGTITADQAGYTVNTGEWYAVRQGNVVTMRFVLDFNWNSPADTSPTFTFQNMPLSIAFNVGGGTNDNKALVVPRLDSGTYGEATVFPRNSFSIAVYKTTALSGFTATGQWSTGHGSLGKSVTFSYDVTGGAGEDQTPYITLHDNVAAGALGLPEATATEAGTVPSYEKVADASLSVSGTTAITTAKLSGTRIDDMVTLNLILNVTTGSASVMTITPALPASFRPDSVRNVLYHYNRNGVNETGFIYINTDGTIGVYRSISSGNNWISAQTMQTGLNGRHITISYTTTDA